MWISQGAARSGGHRGAEGLPDNYGSGGETASSWQLVGEDEDRCPGMRCEPKAQFLELIEHRFDSGNKPGTFGFQENSQGANQADAQHQGDSSGKGVVQDDNGAPRLQGQDEDFRLPGPKVGDQR